MLFFELFTSCALIRWGGSGLGCQPTDGWNQLEPNDRGIFGRAEVKSRMHAAAEDFLGCELSLGKLFFRQPKLDHHPLLAFVVDQEMAMEQNAAVFFQVRARDGLAPRTVGIEGRGP